MTGSSFDPRGRGDSRPGEDTSGGSVDSLNRSTREANTFAISRELHDNLLLCLSSLESIYPNVSEMLRQRAEKMEVLLAVPAKDRSLCHESSLIFADYLEAASYAQGLVQAIEALENILHSDKVIGDPSQRKLGEVPVQELVGTLRELMRTTLGTVCQMVPVANGEYIDGSLQALFHRHEEELARLGGIPTKVP